MRIIHPDPATSGGLAETKRIGDYAAEHGIGMALHMAASPVATLAAAHIAAATASFLALEYHSFDVPNWSRIVTGLPDPLVEQGFITVPETPGLGFDDLNLDVVSGFLDPDEPGLFEPTDDWDNERVNDRLWS